FPPIIQYVGQGLLQGNPRRPTQLPAGLARIRPENRGFGFAQQLWPAAEFTAHSSKRAQAVEDGLHRMSIAAAEIVHVPAGALFCYQEVSAHDIADVGKVPVGLEVACVQHRRTAAALDFHDLSGEMRDRELGGLARTYVIERPGTDDVQPSGTPG